MYDWVIVGAGFAGVLLSFELIQKGFQVLLIERNGDIWVENNYLCHNNFDPTKNNHTHSNKINYNATQLSYGGLAFWSGSNLLTNQLCQESITYYQNLVNFVSQFEFTSKFHSNLQADFQPDIEYRELDLLLTIPNNLNPVEIAQNYASRFSVPPQILDIETACDLEPLLNPGAISGALTYKHGHIHPQKTTITLLQAFLQMGGKLEIATVTNIQTERVTTSKGDFMGKNIAIATGGLTRDLLQRSHIPGKIYFTHAEIIQTPPVDLGLQTLIMPANLQRFNLETQSTQDDTLWLQPGNEPATAILDCGAVQFIDGSIRIGQISRTLTDINADIDTQASEQWLRQSIGNIIPSLGDIPGTYQRCLVAFCGDSLPLVGKIPDRDGLYVFSGFSNPLVFIPPLAQRFCNWVMGEDDWVIEQLYPGR